MRGCALRAADTLPPFRALLWCASLTPAVPSSVPKPPGKANTRILLTTPSVGEAHGLTARNGLFDPARMTPGQALQCVDLQSLSRPKRGESRSEGAGTCLEWSSALGRESYQAWPISTTRASCRPGSRNCAPCPQSVDELALILVIVRVVHNLIHIPLTLKNFHAIEGPCGFPAAAYSRAL